MEVWVIDLDMKQLFDRIEFNSILEVLLVDGMDDVHLHRHISIDTSGRSSNQGTGTYSLRGG